MTELEKYLKDLDKPKNEAIEAKRKQFIIDYPVDNINDLSLDEFLIAKEGFGNPNSFCRRISYGLKTLASVGNMFFNIFGIYYDKNNEIALSDTFSKKFGNDYDAAFVYIKSLITRLLSEFLKHNYTYIDECELNNQFKQRLLIVYFGDILIPVTATETINGYCNAMNLAFEKDDTTLDKNFSLFLFKNSSEELKSLSNIDYMGLCDCLWRQHIKYDNQADSVNKLDRTDKRIIVNKYIEQNEELFGFTEEKNYKKELEYLSNIETTVEEVKQIDSTEKELLVKNRIGQGWFRNQLIKKYKKCMICGISNNKLLRASHIKNWSISNNEERLDINNGLLLCAQHDALFDRCLITSDDNGDIKISKQLSEEDISILGLNRSINIPLNEKMKRYMLEHNKNLESKCDIVLSEKYGVGEIIEQDSDYINVRFKIGEKRFIKESLKNGLLKKVF